MLQIMLELLIAAKYNQVHDIFLQVCLPSYTAQATKGRVKRKEENFLWQKYIEGEDYLKIHLWQGSRLPPATITVSNWPYLPNKIKFETNMSD